MNVTFSPMGDATLRFTTISLGKVHPMLNGKVIEDAQVEILENTLDTEEKSDWYVGLRYTAATLRTGAFILEIRWDAANSRCWIKGVLEQPSDFSLMSFGWCFDDISNVRAFLRNGYHSWDGSHYVDPDSLSLGTASITGYAMSQLLPASGNGSIVCGFDRHDRFQQPFTFILRDGKLVLEIATLWDQKQWEESARCETEWLVIFEHAEVEEALRQWAWLVADAAPVPPRQLSDRITGWCSWYNLYASITEENIQEHLQGVAEVRDREDLSLRVFQIDDGFTPEMGDWLAVKPQFPRGMIPLLADIRAAGFVPGLWIAPFVVGNRSRLYQDHPDWVIQDCQTGGPLVQMRFYGENRWHKRSEEYYILDATHPDAFDYLRQVFRTWRHDWGCEYFKTDFMLFGSEHGPDRARWHTPGLTRIEVWRQVAVMIREEIGDAIWSGCGCPLWASVGLVDAIRIGRDVGEKWRGDQSAQGVLGALMLRNFAHAICWQADPDCLLLRSRFHYLTDSEVRSLALYAGMSGGVLMTSDTLHELSPERLKLFKLLLTTDMSACRYPMLGQPNPDTVEKHLDPVIVQIRDGETSTIAHFFNTGEEPVQRRYKLHNLAIPAPATCYDSISGAVWAKATEEIQVNLQPHESILLTVSIHQ